MRVDEAIARELRRQGVDVVFGLAGSDTVRLGACLEDLGVRYVAARHESQAVAMADGYSRVTGRVGVAIASRGPGFTNAISSMVCASKARSRVIVIFGDTAIGVADPGVASAQRVDPKHVEQDAICTAAGIVSAVLRSPAAAVADLRTILARSELGGTIAVHIPTDVLGAAAGTPGHEPAQVRLPAPVDVPEPDPGIVAAIADVIQSGWAARRPVILAGRGAFWADARPELEQLGDRVGALFATTLMNRSFFAGHPYDIGVCGSLSTSIGSELLAQADLVLAFGASLNRFTTYEGTLLRNARIVQVDTDKMAFGRHGPAPELPVHADAKAMAGCLTAELERRAVTADGFRSAGLAGRLSAHRSTDDFRDESAPGALDPRSVMARLDDMLPRARTLVVEAGDHLRFAAKYLGVPPPPAFVFPMETFAVGMGMGTAIGAAVGDPSRLTVLDIGDGGMMMTLGDLETAIRCRIPMVVLISNNGGLASEMKALNNAGLPTGHAEYPVRWFAPAAAAMGAEARTVTSFADLDQLAGRLGQPIEGPLVIDCRVAPKFDAD
jgi:thiamine pyrophosphate-dependent acetolactate synthase large subunit-like protein